MAKDNGKISKLIESAEDFMKKGERQKALTELHKVLDIDSSNKVAIKRISQLEREVSAMRNFKKTRDSRTHKTGNTVSSDDFVDECITRSEQAFKQGDEVRALQELERAKRHDPDNKLVRRKILIVRRQIKTDNLYDLALAKLLDGNPAVAVKNARAIFKAWPAAPVLASLLEKIEAYKPESDQIIEEIEELEDFVDEDEIEQEEEAEQEKVSPAEAAIVSIRGKISRNDYTSALAEAKDAAKKHPENSTIAELVTRLQKLSGSKKSKVAAVPVTTPPKETVKKEKAEEGKKKPPIGLIAAIVVVLILAVVFVPKLLKSSDPVDTPVADTPVFEPYSVTYSVAGVENFSVTVDGSAITLLPDKTFVIDGDSEGTRVIEVRANGFETVTEEISFESGQEASLEISLDSLGTNTVQVTLQADNSDPEQVTWLVDGEEVDTVVELPTGLHVFQAVQEGFNSVPESLLVDYSSTGLSVSLALLSQEESQITLALAGDIPGSASFTIDGNRVGTGVRRVSEVLSFGEHTLSVSIENYEPWSRTITLDANGYSATVSPAAIATTGRLLIAPEPWANVSIDGVSVGTTPMAPVELEEGEHNVVLTNPDYEDQSQTVTIVTGEDASIRYTASEIQPDEPEEIAEDLPVTSPFPISQVGPAIPDLARQMGDIHGYVTLEVLVGADGSVQNVSVISDELGLGCGAAAEDAVRQWVFSPATQGGVPVEVPTQVQVRFDID